MWSSTHALNDITRTRHMDEASKIPSPSSKDANQPVLADEPSKALSPMLGDATQSNLIADASTIHTPILNGDGQSSLTDEATTIPTPTLDKTVQPNLMEVAPPALFHDQGDEYGVSAPAAFDTKQPAGNDFQLVWTPPNPDLNAC